MAPSVYDILNWLARPGVAGHQGVVDLAAEEPHRLAELVAKSARRLRRGSTAVDAALSLVPDEDLQWIADESIAALRDGADRDTSQAASLVALLGLQAPATLQRHLRTIWRLRPNAESYYAEWPWRGAGPADIRLLEHTLTTATDPELRRRAWRCLVESRTSEGLDAALRSLGTAVPDDAATLASLQLVGIEREDGAPRRLTLDTTCHIVFPEGFITPSQWSGVRGTLQHPTWRPDGRRLGAGRFGGAVEVPCAVCGSPLHRLLALDRPPPGWPGPSQVVTCMSCLGWSVPVLFFSHDGDAVRPTGPEVPPQPPELTADPLPEAPIEFAESLPRWRLQGWAMANDRENLHRLGGEPTWIQSPDFPRCPQCARTMLFVLQLDSLDIDGGPEWLWGSGGILYVFWCGECSVTATFWQCT